MRLRFIAWCALIALLLIGHLIWFWLLRGERILYREWTVASGQALLTLALAGVLLLLRTTPADAIRLSRRRSIILVVGGAVVLQSLALVLLWPGLSEDITRYRLDGRTWLAGASPYVASPEQLRQMHTGRADGGLQRVDLDSIDWMVPHAHLHTIYPPMSQALFTLAAGVEKLLAPPPAVEQTYWREALPHLPPLHRGLIFRILFAAAAVASTGVLILMLSRAGRSIWWSILFGWNPLVVLESGGMGHQDIAGALLLLLAIYAAQNHRRIDSAIWLTVAVAIKPFALLLLPAAYQKSCSTAAPGCAPGKQLLVTFAVAAAVIFVPLLIGHGYRGWIATMLAYASWSNVALQWIGLILLLATIVLAFRGRWTMVETAYWLFLIIFLAGPFHPWYLIWLICLLPLLPPPLGWTAITWCGVAGLNYLVWQTDDWTLSRPQMLAQYLPVYAVLVIELARFYSSSRQVTSAR